MYFIIIKLYKITIYNSNNIITNQFNHLRKTSILRLCCCRCIINRTNINIVAIHVKLHIIKAIPPILTLTLALALVANKDNHKT